MIPRPILHELGDETPQPEIRSYCRRCARTWPPTSDDGDEFFIVSPTGIAHVGEDYGMTACGIDATGETWWWRL
jgi:hypothetical protein